MNYLAHILLSGPDPDVQVGGLLGDFVKGPHTDQYPERIALGIRLHRRIDSATDSDPDFRAALALLPSPWRRYGGLLLDVYFDHLLASNWRSLGQDSLDDFCRAFYANLRRHRALLPERAQFFCQRAPEVRWLQSYANPAMIPPMLDNLGRRLRRPVALGEAWPILDRQRFRLEPIFQQLLAGHRDLADAFLQHTSLQDLPCSASATVFC